MDEKSNALVKKSFVSKPGRTVVKNLRVPDLCPEYCVSVYSAVNTCNVHAPVTDTKQFTSV